ncbi:hypothetical protein ACEE90_01405 [Corynebacterium phoceense]|uniref:hypothetical protein n=1 Tax=Corynebacterium phoceense TaxID=1686286 RepID=UPI0034CDFF10
MTRIALSAQDHERLVDAAAKGERGRVLCGEVVGFVRWSSIAGAHVAVALLPLGYGTSSAAALGGGLSGYLRGGRSLLSALCFGGVCSTAAAINSGLWAPNLGADESGSSHDTSLGIKKGPRTLRFRA